MNQPRYIYSISIIYTVRKWKEKERKNGLLSETPRVGVPEKAGHNQPPAPRVFRFNATLHLPSPLCLILWDKRGPTSLVPKQFISRSSSTPNVMGRDKMIDAWIPVTCNETMEKTSRVNHSGTRGEIQEHTTQEPTGTQMFKVSCLWSATRKGQKKRQKRTNSAGVPHGSS